MLVCSVVLRPKRTALAASITEATSAFDAPSLGVIFATLTDNPGTASDTVNAFVGQMMVEAASAADVVSTGSIQNAAIVEETIANAVAQFPFTYASMAAETATAASSQDATVGVIVVVYGAALEGVFVDPRPPSTLVGTDAIDSGPITIFEP
jgi:CTP:molybdopterin cytidylyltransferase MocA